MKLSEETKCVHSFMKLSEETKCVHSTGKQYREQKTESAGKILESKWELI